MEISPELWRAIKNTERGLDGPGPEGMLRLRARSTGKGSRPELGEFLASKGGRIAHEAPEGRLLLEIPAMYALELWLHPAVEELEPAGSDRAGRPGRNPARRLALGAFGVVLGLTLWLGLDQYHTFRPQAPPQTKPPVEQPKANPQTDPAGAKAPLTPPQGGEKPISTPARKPAPPKGEADKTQPAEPPPKAEAKNQPQAKTPGPDAKKPESKPAAKPEVASAPAASAAEAGQKAMDAMWQGQPERAARLLRRAVRQWPDHLGLRVNLGLVLMELGRLDQAERQFKAVLRRKPNDQEAQSALQLIRAAKDH